MKVSSTEEYGLRCAMHVARAWTEGPVSATQVADAEGISVPYAQKLLGMLSRADLIVSRRGASGGYELARSPDTISVGELLRALDGGFDVGEICDRHSGDRDTCAHSTGCTIRPMWSFIEDFLTRTLDSLSLETLLKNPRAVSERLGRTEPAGQLDCPAAQIMT